MGNPLINELLIGIGSKDRFSMDQPKNDSQFANFFLDPPIVRIVEALYGGALAVPAPPRTDLLPARDLCAAHRRAAARPPGPVADLLRLNTGVAADADRRRGEPARAHRRGRRRASPTAGASSTT